MAACFPVRLRDTSTSGFRNSSSHRSPRVSFFLNLQLQAFIGKISFYTKISLYQILTIWIDHMRRLIRFTVTLYEKHLSRNLLERINLYNLFVQFEVTMVCIYSILFASIQDFVYTFLYILCCAGNIVWRRSVFYYRIK